MAKQTVTVHEVTSAPAIGKPEMMSGIRTKEAAQKWAEQQGYSTVYFYKKAERVYADRLTKRVDVLAQQLESKSNHVARWAEEQA